MQKAGSSRRVRAPAQTRSERRSTKGKRRRIFVDRNTPPAASVLDALKLCLAEVDAHVEGVRAGEDAEALHGLRVSIRRFRTAAKIGREAGLPKFSGNVRGDLKWLWALLGRKRDLDVLVEQTWPAVVGVGVGSPATRRFERAARRARTKCQGEVRHALGGPRFHALMLALHRFVTENADAAAARSTRRELSKIAKRVLGGRAERVRRHGKSANRLGTKALHALRIEVKKLRYPAEFFASSDTPRGSKRYLKRLVAVQTALGRLNDLAVSRKLCVHIGDGLPPADVALVRKLWQRHDEKTQPRCRRALAKALQELRRTAPFWS
jgi:CHAD domain-containing protein